MMKHAEELKEMLCDEIDKIADKGELTAGSLETAHKLTDTLKNVYKVEMLEQAEDYADGYGYDSDDMGGRAYAQRRDSRGRYSRADSGYSRAATRYGRGRYARAEAKESIMEQIEDLMTDAKTEKERQVLQRAMTSLENA